MNAPRLVVAPERPTTTGSWDDLMSRNRGRSRKLTDSQVLLSENEERRRAQGGYGDHGGVSTTNSGTTGGSPTVRPRRMVLHHPDQRTSQAFAAHVASLHGRPSPLSMSVSSDSLPEVDIRRNLSTTQPLDLADPLNNAVPLAFPPRPSMYTRSQRMSDGPRVVDPAFTMGPRPTSFQSYDAATGPRNHVSMRTVSWSGMPPTQEDIAFQNHPRRGSPPRYSGTEWQQRRPELIKHIRLPRSPPNEIFNKLPTEVLRLILDHLRILHLERQSNSCATCWMRNCCAVSICNKKMLQVARAALYEHIQLVGADSSAQRKKYKNIYSTRLILLRRSLRADHKLAELVRSIKVPALPDGAPIDAREYHDIVASVVMACPNLERLDGFYPTYDHGHSRLFNALGSRPALKEMTWLIDAPPLEQEPTEGNRRSQSRSRRSQSRSRPSKSRSSSTPAQAGGRHATSRGYLVSELANKFVLQHMYWKELTHLTIHCLPGANLSTPNDLIAVVLTYLPSLKTLCLANVPARSFDDDTLLAIPRPLTKLSLAHCPGVTSSGLATFASGTAASDLETLTLIHQNLDSLATVVRILSKLSKLTQLHVVQALAPRLPNDTFVWLMPYLASPSLRTLHWDIFESSSTGLGEGGGTEADEILARSIMANGFPSLSRLRVPQDPGGMFQALCRPHERIDLPGDRYLNLLPGQTSSNGPRPLTNGKTGSRVHVAKHSSSTHSYSSSGVDVSTMSDTADGRSSSETGDSGKAFVPTREAGSDLHQARLAAQARLEAARRFPRFEINVTDEMGQLIESSGLAGFLGDVTSPITYTLTPDLGGTDEHGGLVGIADLLSDGGEDLTEKGDLAFRSGAGYGTGCIAHAFSRAQALVEAKQPTAARGKLIKGGGSGGKKSQVESIEMSTRAKEGCTGRTRSSGSETSSNDKKGGKSDWHTERGRWRGRVELT